MKIILIGFLIQDQRQRLTRVPFSSVKGHYIYIKTSTPAKEGWKAQLVSEPFEEKDNGCVSFWYFMFGSVRTIFNFFLK